VAHPLIHLGYAYELSSHTVAIEALAMGSCFYNFLHKYLDDPSYTKSPTSVSPSASPLQLLEAIHSDKRFDNMFEHPGPQNVEPLFDKKEELVLEYWNAWKLTDADPTQLFAQSQMSAVAILVGTHKPDSNFDFFLVHLLTSSHAVRILLPLVPPQYQIPLVRQWWLFAVAVYISQLRPKIDLSRIDNVDLEGRDWKFVEHKALNGRPALDAHYVKALRAMREAARTWGDEESFYLRAAVKFAGEFKHWGGFDPSDVEMERAENEMHQE
jgi:Questin oxidase-like